MGKEDNATNHDVLEMRVAKYCDSQNKQSTGQFKYDYKTYDNGVIEVRRWDNNSLIDEKNNPPQYGYDSVYIPSSGNTSNMMSYVPGNEGRAADDNLLVNQVVEGNGNFDYLVSISNEAKDNNCSMFFGTEVAKAIGLEINNVGVDAFSAGGAYGFTRLEEFLEENPDVNASLVVSDGIQHFHEHYHATNSLIQNYDTIVEKNIPIVFATLEDSNKYLELEKWLYSKGLTNIYTLRQTNQYQHSWNDKDHVELNKNILGNQIPEFFLGVSPRLVNYNLDKCNYMLNLYDPSNPNANAYGLVESDFYNPNLLQLIVPDVLSKYNSASLVGGVLSSDIFKVYESMCGINDSIRNNVALYEQEPLLFEGGSTTGIPAGLMDAEKSVFGISASVASKLNQEAKVIMSIANVIYQMDQELAKQTEGLSDGSELLDICGKNLLKTIDNIVIDGFEIPNYMFESDTHQEGSTGRLSMTDLTALYSNGLCGALKKNIDSEIEDAKNTQAQIEAFKEIISGSKSFQGEIWETVGTKLDEYVNLMEIRVQSMQILEEAYEKALKLLIDYMGNYDMLDDSLLPQLRAELDQLLIDIESAQDVLSRKVLVSKMRTLEDGTIEYYEELDYYFSLGERREAMNFITQSMQTRFKLEYKIKVLEGLPVVISEAEQIVNEALASIYTNYGSQASSVLVGKEAEFISI